MIIQRRNLPVFILLNCLTLGIYGAIQSNKMGNEINALCKNDGEQPGMGYFGALFIRAIPAFFGILVGLVAGIISTSLVSMRYSYLSFGVFGDYYRQLRNYQIGLIFANILVFVVFFTLIGHLASGIYHKYWWFKQTSRLQLNANRYNMEVREKGTDHFMFRTATEVPLLPATIALKCAALLLPTLMCFLIWFGSPIFALILFTLFVMIFCIFGTELTAGSCFSLSRVIKTLNRYSAVYKNGMKPFDPMAYEYYPCADSTYPAVLPDILAGKFVAPPQVVPEPVPDEWDLDNEIVEEKTIPKYGCIVGVKGSCSGYYFDLNPGEEIIIGKDAKVSNVVIDPAYKEISRKHVSVVYDAERDVYRVTDYSSNGTWADEQRLIRNETINLRRGTVLKLANDKNVFRLG